MIRMLKTGKFAAFIALLTVAFALPAMAQQERPRTAKKAIEAARQAEKAAKVVEQNRATREKSIPRDL